MERPTPSSALLAPELPLEVQLEVEPAPNPESLSVVETAAPALPPQLEALRGVPGDALDPQRAPERLPQWNFDRLVGRLCELCRREGTPLLSATAPLVLQAQQQAQPVAWVGVGASSFHPPDLAAWGVDLSALAFVRVSQPQEGTRAADTLLRSGAFGLVVVDLGASPPIPLPAQTRLSGLAKKHQAVLLLLTREKSSRFVQGSLVSLRAEGRVERGPNSTFHCRLQITKDKQRGPGWEHEEVCHGPDGLC